MERGTKKTPKINLVQIDLIFLCFHYKTKFDLKKKMSLIIVEPTTFIQLKLGKNDRKRTEKLRKNEFYDKTEWNSQFCIFVID